MKYVYDMKETTLLWLLTKQDTRMADHKPFTREKPSNEILANLGYTSTYVYTIAQREKSFLSIEPKVEG